MGVIFESENDSDGIKKILKELQTLQSYAGEGEERIYKEQGIVGDQLTVERGNQALINNFNEQTIFFF